MKTKLETLLIELVQVAEWYKQTEYQDVKDHYNNYAEILINFDVPRQHQDNYRAYWEKLKDG